MAQPPRTLKTCLICGIEYTNRERNGKKLDEERSCPACGTPETEHKQFEYVYKQIPYDQADFIPTHSDDGCDVAKVFNGKTAKCVECPFQKCLDELHYKWHSYARRSEIIQQVFKLTDKGMSAHCIATQLCTYSDAVHYWLLDRETIEPIYNKLRGKDLAKFGGPK